jgi:RecA/RadA recombinase
MNAKFMNALLKASGNDKAAVAVNGTIYDSDEYISTGNLLCNALLSGNIYHGIPSNRQLQFCGEEGTGKTFFLLQAGKTYLEDHPDDIIVYFESEGAINKEILVERGLDINRVILFPVGTVEEFTVQATNLIKEYSATKKEDRQKMIVFLDSLGMLASEKEILNTENNDIKQDFTRVKQLKSCFRIITPKLSQLGIPFIYTNHVYNTTNQYDPFAISGGSGGKFAASFIIFLSRSQFKDEAKNMLGIIVKVKLLKSRKTKKDKFISIPLHFEKGIDMYGGLFEFCYEQKLIVRKGTKMYYWHTKPERMLLKKEILGNLAGFFTTEILEEFNSWCENYFLLGRAAEQLIVDDIVDDDDED